ncbi:MAG: extracellular solute-binding protein [Chloroflexi bacterium]|nr:extracellular solute-binding protein [Chloroflexota bacterium]
MKNTLLMSCLLLPALLLLASCASSTATPPAPENPRPVGGVPASTPERDWANILVHAKKEGKVSAYSAGWGAEIRVPLTEAFEKKHGIELEFTGFGRGVEQANRARMEKAAGLNIADVFPSGSGTLLTVMKPEGLLGDMEPFLILPEVTDPKLWGGQLPFIDKDRKAFAMIGNINRYIMYNTEQVKKGEIASYRDLLKPQYKGKINLNDPSLTGSGSAMFSFLAQTWTVDESKDFLRRLVKEQGVIILRDTRLQVETVARGKYAIALAPMPAPVREFLKAGAPVDMAIVKEGTAASPSAGVIGVPVTVPRPNATRVFINWLLSREGQTLFSRVYGSRSMRSDVPAEGVDPVFLPQPGESVVLETEDRVLFQGRMMTIIGDVLRQVSE